MKNTTLSVSNALAWIETYEGFEVKERAVQLLQEPEFSPRKGMLSERQIVELRQEAWRTCHEEENTITAPIGYLFAIVGRKGMPTGVVLQWIHRRYGRIAHACAAMLIVNNWDQLVSPNGFIANPWNLRDAALTMATDQENAEILGELYFVL